MRFSILKWGERVYISQRHRLGYKGDLVSWFQDDEKKEKEKEKEEEKMETEEGEKEKQDKEKSEKEKEPEPNFQMLDNPARVMKAQVRVERTQTHTLFVPSLSPHLISVHQSKIWGNFHHPHFI